MEERNIIRQRTLNEKFSLKGKGLHTGLNVTITFNPAPENHGYKIRRVDLPGQPVIEASAENVISTNRGTALSSNGIQVGTVEHGLAALYGNEIDNCLIEVDAPEFPVLDGSSIEYVKEILISGIREQTAPREYYVPKEKIAYKDEVSGAHLILLPANNFNVQTQIVFDSEILNIQSAHLSDISEFNGEIAWCRTFVFVREIESLIENGLIKGGNLGNAIVIYDKPIEQKLLDKLADSMHVKRKNSGELGYIMNESLRFPNEPARHKLLDLIGDIALTGKFIKGTVVAVCPGHKANTVFARAILEDIKKNSPLQTVFYF